jgi:hypothetical protein
MIPLIIGSTLAVISSVNIFSAYFWRFDRGGGGGLGG